MNSSSLPVFVASSPGQPSMQHSANSRKRADSEGLGSNPLSVQSGPAIKKLCSQPLVSYHALHRTSARLARKRINHPYSAAYISHSRDSQAYLEPCLEEPDTRIPILIETNCVDFRGSGDDDDDDDDDEPCPRSRFSPWTPSPVPDSLSVSNASSPSSPSSSSSSSSSSFLDLDSPLPWEHDTPPPPTPFPPAWDWETSLALSMLRHESKARHCGQLAHPRPGHGWPTLVEDVRRLESMAMDIVAEREGLTLTEIHEAEDEPENVSFWYDIDL
ncbi:unnamed protein product [Mycena citricolor]|uniref:Uncharacterized protein n=1 Tax=Mycena citricolor TaxID=2018698 RepID=A0AAD2HRJ7_9AGAR|nr:unnamed protein product [Mycena citricolor]